MQTRRRFLQTAAGSSALLTFAPGIPSCWLRAAERAGGVEDDRVLVVVQLSGGNDGLNTVVPFGDDEYYRNRYTLGQGENAVHKIDDYVGLHPSMNGFSDLISEGLLSVIQGVGYPQPNRSHFESMDLWHTAHRATDQIATGWLGRVLDSDEGERSGDVPAIHLGAEDQPLALAAEHTRVPTIASLSGFRLEASGQRDLAAAIRDTVQMQRPSENDLLSFIQQSGVSALETSQRVEEVTGDYRSPIDYPGTQLGEKLRIIAQLIGSGLDTRVYYVTLDGFDTHSNQAEAHAGLLSELSGAVTAFVRDLQQLGKVDRVATMVFSEFGRRVKENASRGTDHGAAAPMFLAGGRVQGGLLGEHPSMTDLDDGDLKHAIDYRQVYSPILESWMGLNAGQILGSDFDRLPLFA